MALGELCPGCFESNVDAEYNSLSLVRSDTVDLDADCAPRGRQELKQSRCFGCRSCPAVKPPRDRGAEETCPQAEDSATFQQCARPSACGPGTRTQQPAVTATARCGRDRSTARRARRCCPLPLRAGGPPLSLSLSFADARRRVAATCAPMTPARPGRTSDPRHTSPPSRRSEDRQMPHTVFSTESGSTTSPTNRETPC